ncbi:putative uncharacterized protein DDB_G0289263 [Rhopalosiphum maidis]|uniref:putative uncharacterized protein DDB_G0289263 n=1 Tax=Rhopalosiphum maidis TaxID=43146 RepID=UPI000EFEA270|nr:putative uncharacterized protein DDB_G0289263 [Rhopalosiphum maidis]
MMKKYNAMHEHNYFCDKKVNRTVKITNDYDECDSTLDWYIDLSSIDEEEDIKNMRLSHLLKLELEKDLLKESKNKKSSKDRQYDELINKNNQNMLNIANNSNNITPNISTNKKARTDHYNNSLQGVNFSLGTINPKVKKDNDNVTKTSANIGGGSYGPDSKKEFQWHDEEINHTEMIKNDYDECDSVLDWYRDLCSSDEDEEEDIKDMPLSHLLKIELEKDLFKEVRP